MQGVLFVPLVAALRVLRPASLTWVHDSGVYILHMLAAHGTAACLVIPIAPFGRPGTVLPSTPAV